MKNLCLFICLFSCQHLLACCFNVNYNIFSILHQKENMRTVFTIRIDSSFFLSNGSYRAKGTVLEHFDNDITIPNQVEIYSGGETTAGGQHLEEGKIYFVAGYEFEKGKFSAFVCDGHSQQLSDNHDSSMIISKMYDYKKHRAQKYTGKVKYYNDTLLIAEGKLRKGEPHGRWKYYDWESLLLSEMNYRKGKKTGTELIYANINALHRNIVVKNKTKQIYTSYNEYGKITRRTIEKYDKKRTALKVVKIYDDNGKINQKYTPFQMVQTYLFPPYVGDFEQHDRNGKLTNKGKYDNGVKVEQWLELNPKDSTLETKIYPVIKKTKGIFTWYHATGIKSVEGKRNRLGKQGVWVIYNEKGDTSSTETFRDNNKNGISNRYDEKNRLIMTINYVDDVENGLFITFHPKNKQIENECQYKSGKRIGLSKSYYDSGKIRSISNHDNGKEHRNDITYHENGKIHSTINYVNGTMNGPYIAYDEQGNVIEKGMYDYGFKVGEWLEYNENGQLKQRCIHKKIITSMDDSSNECEYFNK